MLKHTCARGAGIHGDVLNTKTFSETYQTDLFVSVQCSECQSGAISNKRVNVHHDSLKVAKCPCRALNVKVESNKRG